MDLVEKIKTLAIEKLAANPSQFIVDVIASQRKGPQKVLIVIDGDNGVTIDDCADLSRELSKSLDELAWLDQSYSLEVSTPGLDQPLVLLRQFKKNIGRGLKVKTQTEIVEGKLTEVSEEKINLLQEIGSGKKKETKTVEIPFSSIEKAFVLVSFK
jgi:ribosome maturation factor RimP